MFDSSDELNRLYWTIGLVIAVPILTVVLVEMEQMQRRQSSKYRSVFRYLRVPMIPLMAAWLILTKVMGVPVDDRLARIVATLADVSAIVVGLSLVNAILFSNISDDSWQARTPKLLVDIVRSILVIIGAAVVLSLVWGVDLGQIAAALGIGAIVIGLAIAEPLGNVFAGLMLLVERPITVGDWIKIGERVGQVLEINWRAIHLRTYLGELVVVPNAILAKESFSNFSRPTKLHAEPLKLGFSYDDPPNKVRATLLDCLDRTPGVRKEPPATVQVVNYGDFSVDYEVIFYVDDYKRLFEVRDAFMTTVWYAARREGITIPFPTAMEYSGEMKDTLLPPNPHPSIDETLDGIPMLAGLSESQRSKLVADSYWHSYAKNEIVTDLGEIIPGLFLIVKGRVRATRTNQDGTMSVIFEAGEGEAFGESIANGTRLSDCRFIAIEDLDCVILRPNTLQGVLMTCTRFAQEISHLTEIRNPGSAARLYGQHHHGRM
jgi:small-conductance mechanosensitive channel